MFVFFHADIQLHNVQGVIKAIYFYKDNGLCLVSYDTKDGFFVIGLKKPDEKTLHLSRKLWTDFP